MRGIVYTTFSDLVIEKYGLPIWDKLLSKVKPASKGVYTAADIYSDEEIVSLVVGLSEITKENVEDLFVSFGKYMFEILAEKFPVFFREGVSLKEFILSIERVIHVEVKKLYPDASLPRFRYEDLGPRKLIVYYTSPRKLCHLGIGLMRGASGHFKTPLQINHTKCLHKGDPYCKFELDFS